MAKWISSSPEAWLVPTLSCPLLFTPAEAAGQDEKGPFHLFSGLEGRFSIKNGSLPFCRIIAPTYLIRYSHLTYSFWLPAINNSLEWPETRRCSFDSFSSLNPNHSFLEVLCEFLLQTLRECFGKHIASTDRIPTGRSQDPFNSMLWNPVAGSENPLRVACTALEHSKELAHCQESCGLHKTTRGSSISLLWRKSWG